MAIPTKPHVLIVDDDPDAREVMVRVVHGLGLDARTAGDGLEALEQLQVVDDPVPMLILLDLMMPKLDGFAVYTWLRGNPRTRHIPVVVITACTRNQIDMLYLPGVYAVLQKGTYSVVDLSNLIDQVRNPALERAAGPGKRCNLMANRNHQLSHISVAHMTTLEES